MNPGRYNIKFYRATTLNRSVTYKIDGVAESLAGYTAAMHVRERVDSASTVALLTTENGGLVLNESTGSVRIFVSAAASAALPIGEFLYDMNITAPDGTVSKLLRGGFVVLDPVTE
jgi:hypothetical protein